jgi:hypothetical protein|tara:strand:- start:157 stop:288 length:132 start_codon:yes stop_codon:yes gene_type:complete
VGKLKKKIHGMDCRDEAMASSGIIVLVVKWRLRQAFNGLEQVE